MVVKETVVVKEGAEPAGPDVTVIRLHFRAGGEKSEWPMYVARPRDYMAERPEIRIELAPVPGGEYAAKVMTRPGTTPKLGWRPCARTEVFTWLRSTAVSAETRWRESWLPSEPGDSALGRRLLLTLVVLLSRRSVRSRCYRSMPPPVGAHQC